MGCYNECCGTLSIINKMGSTIATKAVAEDVAESIANAALAYGPCDFVYKRSGRACAMPGATDETGIRCCKHLAKRVRSWVKKQRTPRTSSSGTASATKPNVAKTTIVATAIVNTPNSTFKVADLSAKHESNETQRSLIEHPLIIKNYFVG